MSMHCKYCGAALPTKGGVCPSCGRMIPVSQQKEMKEMLDPRWNQYRNQDTAFYKSNSYENEKKVNKPLLFIIVVILVILLIIIIKGLG